MEYDNVIILECDSKRHLLSEVDEILDYGEDPFGRDTVWYTCSECKEAHSSILIKDHNFNPGES